MKAAHSKATNLLAMPHSYERYHIPQNQGVREFCISFYTSKAAHRTNIGCFLRTSSCNKKAQGRRHNSRSVAMTVPLPLTVSRRDFVEQGSIRKIPTVVPPAAGTARATA